jgi:hypothetical protein
VDNNLLRIGGDHPHIITQYGRALLVHINYIYFELGLNSLSLTNVGFLTSGLNDRMGVPIDIDIL